jgi:2-succinyl-6-hydroxy-2,4-cyclohexadiene-1-carboxylate synthase
VELVHQRLERRVGAVDRDDLAQMSTRVLFVPGFMQRGGAWAPVAELLPERYPSVLLDHAEHTFEGRLREIAEQGEGAALCGYSLGGRLAIHAMLRDPGRYRALVTVGASAGIDEPGAREQRRETDERLAAWMEVAPIEDVVGIWERQPLFADQPDALIEAQRVDRLSHDPRHLATLLRTAGQGSLTSAWFELGRADLPWLALAGSRDERYTRAARRIARESPRARWEVVPDAGHAPQLQQPEEVARLLVEFLDEHLGEV